MHEGNEVGRRYGYEEDREAVARTMTPEEHNHWFHIRQAVPALAYALMGIFEGVSPDPETEFADEWFE